MTVDDRTRFFFQLTPEKVLGAVEAQGRRCTGRFLTLNSYENRVFQLELDDGSFVVAKFYRPGRWDDDAILDEHDFLLDLEDGDVPVAAPIELDDGDTLGEVETIRYALFPRIGGRTPEEMDDAQLRQVGRMLARLHSIGRLETAASRPTWHPEPVFDAAMDALKGRLPASVRGGYEATVAALRARCAPLWRDVELQRVHGDCHLGNLLWSPSGLVFLDFDDLVTGPPVQDLWMLIGGRDAWAARRLDVLLAGYDEMGWFDRSTLRLMEPLRAMRMVHFAAWIAKRWDDPAFPLAFPAFGTERWWQDELRALREQGAAVEEALAERGW